MAFPEPQGSLLRENHNRELARNIIWGSLGDCETRQNSQASKFSAGPVPLEKLGPRLVEKSGVQAAINARKTIGVGPGAFLSPPYTSHQISNSRSAFKSQCDKWLQKLDFVIEFT